MKIKKGDKIIVIAGKDLGKKGEVLSVLPKEGKVIVEGINIVKKHIKPGTVTEEGGVIKKEAPLDVSNIMFYDDDLEKGVRLGIKIVDGKKYRVNKATGKVLER